MDNRFDIILVSWNRLDYLKRTIASLTGSNALNECERFIIVDNGSTEKGVAEFLEDLRKQYQAYLVCCPNNKGWGEAVNNALGLSRAPYLMLLNNDVEFNVDFHRKMFESFEHQEKIGILGGWRHTSHGFVKDSLNLDHSVRKAVNNEWFREMDDVPGVCWLLPKIAMQVVGMLPERGACFTKGGNGEDSAYVVMMKQAGFLVGVTKEDVVNHIDGY
jgi:GT2 family glycosyltransferase